MWHIWNIWIAILLIAFCFAIMAYHFAEIRRSLRERRLARNFEKFEQSLLDPNLTSGNSPFLTGETKLPTEVTIHVPNYPDGTALISSIQRGLRVHSLGFLIREFHNGDDLCFDINLNDFVSGVEFLRNHLLESQAPKGTIIEYDGGDLSIHE